MDNVAFIADGGNRGLNPLGDAFIIEEHLTNQTLFFYPPFLTQRIEDQESRQFRLDRKRTPSPIIHAKHR